MGASNWVHIDVDKIVKETDKAFLLSIDEEEIWVPRSQVADPDDYKAGDTNVTISISEWIAREKGFDQ